MENRKGKFARLPDSPKPATPIFPFLFSILFFVSGCGAPGDPVPPSPLVPAAISDVTARQAGDGVELVFSLPPKTVSGEKLTTSPAIEIVRGSLKLNGVPTRNRFGSFTQSPVLSLPI